MIVRWVKAQGGKLRAQGTLHSWSNIFADDNTDVIFPDEFKGRFYRGLAYEQNIHSPILHPLTHLHSHTYLPKQRHLLKP